jgi:hypothetical protein
MPGSICPDTLAENSVTGHMGDLEVLFNGTIQALAHAGAFALKGTGIVDATNLGTIPR